MEKTTAPYGPSHCPSCSLCHFKVTQRLPPDFDSNRSYICEYCGLFFDWDWNTEKALLTEVRFPRGVLGNEYECIEGNTVKIRKSDLKDPFCIVKVYL